MTLRTIGAFTILSAFAWAQDSNISRGLPDLRGLWQALDPRNPKTVVMSFDISQSGNRLTVQVLPPGQPDLVVYEGAFDGAAVITGRFLDLNSPPENRRWAPMRIIVTDANHLQFEDGPALTRATPSEAAYSNENKRISDLPLPARPFDLNGAWSYVNGLKVSVKQVGSEITLQTPRLGEDPYYRGQYARNPEITGRGLASGTTRDNPKWVEGKIIVQDPDHMLFGNKMMFRVSNPVSHDLACDERNTNHVRDYYATLRGTMAIKEQDYRTGTCWLTIGAAWGYAPAQSMLAGLLVASRNPDYAVAFELATRSAKQGDMDGQKLLASMYREGRGTEPDPEQARLWERRAADTQTMAMMRQTLATPGNMLGAIGSFWGTFGGMVDLDLGMTPGNCFSRSVLGNRPTADCPQ